MGQAGDEVELGLDTTASGKVAPVWAALLTGRVPNLRFDDLDGAMAVVRSHQDDIMWIIGVAGGGAVRGW